jgi:hypothetical protein
MTLHIITKSTRVPTEAERLDAYRERRRQYITNPSLFVAIVRRERKTQERKKP